MIAGYSVTLFT